MKTEHEPSLPACTACGACCFSEAPDQIGIYGPDWDRFDSSARMLVEERAGERFMHFVDGRCAALRVDVERGTLTCALYAIRPDCCRWLVPGSEFCRQARRRRGMR